jgi:hypothetical protein
MMKQAIPCQRRTDRLVKFGTGTSSLDVAASYDANVVWICLQYNVAEGCNFVRCGGVVRCQHRMTHTVPGTSSTDRRQTSTVIELIKPFLFAEQDLTFCFCQPQ